MNTKRNWFAWATGLTFAMTAMFGALHGANADVGTIKIVTHSPLSGTNSALGEAIKLGAQLALDEHGKQISALGFKAVLQAEDDKADPAVGVTNANRIIGDADILAVVGHFNSGVFIPASEVYARAGLVAVSPANTNPAVTDRESTRAIANRICGRDDVQGPVGADFVAKKLKAKKVYVVDNRTTYGTGLANAFQDALKKAGAQVVHTASVSDKETDFSALLDRAAADKPDVIYFGGYYEQYGILVKQARQRKVAAALVSGDGADSADLQKIAGAENMTKVYFTSTSVPINMLPAAKNFAKTYKDKFKKEPEGYSAYGYDSMRVVLQGIADAIKTNNGKKPGREQVAAAVRKVSIDGLTGKISFNSRGDIKAAKYVIISAGATYEKNDVISVIATRPPHE